MLFPIQCSLSRPLYIEMIDMRYHELPDWTETVRNEPILSGTDKDNIKATKIIMSHHIHVVACEEFYVHNNIVIYLERKKTVPEELLHPACMYPSCNRISYSTDLCYIARRHTKCIDIDRTIKMQPFVISSGDKISKLL